MWQTWNRNTLEEHHKMRRNALSPRFGLHAVWAPMPADVQELPAGTTLPAEVPARMPVQAGPRLAPGPLRATERMPRGLVMGSTTPSYQPLPPLPLPPPPSPMPRPAHHLLWCLEPLDSSLIQSRAAPVHTLFAALTWNASSRLDGTHEQRGAKCSG